MKLDLQYQEETFQAEIDRVRSGSVPEFRIRLEGPGEFSRALTARLLGRTAAGWLLELDGRIQEISSWRRGGEILVSWLGRTVTVQAQDPRDRLRRRGSTSGRSGDSTLRAKMPGKVVRILRRPGERVAAGEGLVVIEAMKMQNQIAAPGPGTIQACHVREDTSVSTGDLLFELELDDPN